MPLLTILHTCDMHGHLSEEQAALLAALKSARQNCYLLDCGDALRAGNLSLMLRPEMTPDRMNRAGYDAMAMGNRESQLWWWAVRRKLQGFHFPVLSSNLVAARVPIQRRLILETDGVRMGIFALTPQMTPSGPVAKQLRLLAYDPPMTAAGRMVVELRSQVDVLICLSHQGSKFDRDLARQEPALDLIIGGHDHSPGKTAGEFVGKVLIARSSPYAADLGEVKIDVQVGAPPRLTARLLQFTPGAASPGS